MDKSFNDQELSDIMKEIEALEDNFQTDVGKMESSETDVMEELAKLDEDEAIPTTAEVADPEPVTESARVVPMHSIEPTPQTQFHSFSEPKAKASPATMQFKVSGELNLELQFDIEGKVVSLAVNEQGLSIQMEGGMTFSVPLKKAA